MAFTTGKIATGFTLPLHALPDQNWFYSIFILGILFISLFQLMAFVSQKFGVAIVSVAVKMSLIIPVLFALLFYKEQVSFYQTAGIILALAAVYLATAKNKTQAATFSILPLILFLGSGFLDTLIQYVQQSEVAPQQQAAFTSFSFLIAGLIGVCWVLLKERFIPKIHLRSVLGGIVLGIPNYGSIYFLLKALSQDGVSAALIFPINNVGIVAVSALCGFILFKEHLSTRNKMGIILALLSIVLISI